MRTGFIRGPIIALCLTCAGGLVPSAQAAAQATPDLSKIPKVVMDALKARFPSAEIHTWTEESEGGVVLYDLEFTQQGRRFEADIHADGTIENWEQEVAPTDLPPVVRQAVEARYTGSTLKEIMRVTSVKAGNDELEGYEVLLETADKAEVEVTVAPDGKILEDSGKEG